jgi:hypothetical protein
VFMGDLARSTGCRTNVQFRQSTMQIRDPQCVLQMKTDSVRQVCPVRSCA